MVEACWKLDGSLVEVDENLAEDWGKLAGSGPFRDCDLYVKKNEHNAKRITLSLVRRIQPVAHSSHFRAHFGSKFVDRTL